jgi:integrase
MPSGAVNKRKLSDAFIKSVKPETRPVMVWDTYQRGLALAVQPSGYKAFKVVYSFHGRPRWYHLGAADAISSLAEARRLASKVMVQVAEGKDPQAERRAERGAGTFGELAERYVNEYARRNNKSWEQAAKLVRKHLSKWDKMQAAQITRSDVKAVMAHITDTAPILANQVLAYASAIFSWAIREEIGGIKVNPCANVQRNETKSRERILSDSEIPQFWAEFDKLGIEGAALKALLLLGQRPGEVAHMRTEHIVDGCWWEMPGAPVPKLGWPGTKNAQTHRVYLPKIMQDMISELQPTGFVFAGKRGRAQRLTAPMRAICKTLGVNERATPHDLRRTHGSTITALGFGRDAMNRVQNHREGGIASVYDRHEYAAENQKIMEAVANKIMTLIDGKAAENVIAFGKVK